MIYDHFLAAFRDNKYTLELERFCFGGDGYVNATINICGLAIGCAVNKKGYVCWLCDKYFEKSLESVPHLVVKIVAQTVRLIKEDEKEWRRQRIKELKDELEELENK